ncbi:RelA/SpoT domain-containing protein [Gluconacetobacter sp. 1c LMG 22058]|uniref:RelA/SpoT domain-containing protein n=1 Tax=Gluconacetobacter dulcium TaxID=2729096 RepID=A0A7W4K1E1_9PROT|nr:RelA/SpoT domain-containing protein [Gluconacetobacter dulcium]MBB2198598.1 RelA/SpoT domain-containing protein [Gluconacetobacter dulcium]
MNQEASEHIEKFIELFHSKLHTIDTFRQNVELLFKNNPDLTVEDRNIVHSTKSRIKDENHLREKIHRKIADGKEITEENFFSQVTDLAGVRVILLYQDDFSIIHNAIVNKVYELEDWSFGEDPKAYTWDPENIAYFDNIGIKSEVKPSFYTSVHYLVRPHSRSPVRCEIQVRTLFEEIWGEVDHQINYPQPTTNKALSEQLKVLSKIVGAGGRLLDSIYRINN